MEEEIGREIEGLHVERKVFGRDKPSGRDVKGKKTMKRNLALNKKQEVKSFRKPKNLQQMGKDF